MELVAAVRNDEYCLGLQGTPVNSANWQTEGIYYQEGAWQQIVNGNGAPTTLAVNTLTVGSVALAIPNPSTFAPGIEGDGAFDAGTAFAATLEIWGGTNPPGYQGQNYRGSQFGVEISQPINQQYSGGNAPGFGSDELLWRSPPITNTEWVVYPYEFTPTQAWSYFFIKIVQVVRVGNLEPATPPGYKYLLVDGLTIPTAEEATRSCACPEGTDMVFNDPANNYPPATEADCIKEFDDNSQFLDPNTFDITCMYTECTPLQTAVPAQDELGAIWKHNARCDLFANYYNIDYPWEVELIESVGQTVNTVRSVEYQLRVLYL